MSIKTPINIDLMKQADTTKKYNGFKPGISGNPKGRPKGSLNKIQSLFYDDLYHDWESHGNQAIVELRESSPVKYCQLVASIMPKTVELDESGTVRFIVSSEPVDVLGWSERHNLTQVIDSIPVVDED